MVMIASIQLNSQNDVDVNLRVIEAAISAAKLGGADLVVLPENACLMGRQNKLAERFDALSAFYAQLAKELQVCVIAGTLPCPYDGAGKANADKYFQTSLAFDSTGCLVGRYDKIHLFRATVNDGVGSYDEGQTFLAGDAPRLVSFEIGGHRIQVGMMICFDLRFPALAERYRELGADILVAPSAFTFQTGRANWQILLQARALDSQCMVVGSAQGGIHRTNHSERQTWGHSMIVRADGQILATTDATAVPDDGYLVAMAQFDLAKQNQIRQNLPTFACRRAF